MAILTFLLGVALFLAGLGSLWASLNLLPTEMGQLYGVCGVVLVGCATIVLAIGALIVRIGRTGPYSSEQVSKPSDREAAPSSIYIEPAVAEPPTTTDQLDPVPDVTDYAPPVHAIEQAVDRGKPAPQVIGRYAAGGANYVIFSDGMIEAETDNGPIRFANMSDFRSYIANRKR